VLIIKTFPPSLSHKRLKYVQVLPSRYIRPSAIKVLHA